MQTVSERVLLEGCHGGASVTFWMERVAREAAEMDLGKGAINGSASD